MYDLEEETLMKKYIKKLISIPSILAISISLLTACSVPQSEPRRVNRLLLLRRNQQMKLSMLLSEKIYKIRIAKKFLRVLKAPATK